MGVRVAVGSDSQVRIDPFAELRALEDGERLRSQSRVCLANSSTGQVAPSLFAAGSQGGAHSAGIRAGAIAPGLRADLVALDLGHPMLLGAFPVEGDPIHALANLVLSGSPHLVKDVWVGGRHTVDDGVLLRWDAAAEAYCKVTERVFG